jgi:hypothetical protein
VDVEVYISFELELILAILFVLQNLIQNYIATMFYYITTGVVIFNITLSCYIRIYTELVLLRGIHSENWFNQ